MVPEGIKADDTGIVVGGWSTDWWVVGGGQGADIALQAEMYADDIDSFPWRNFSTQDISLGQHVLPILTRHPPTDARWAIIPYTLSLSLSLRCAISTWRASHSTLRRTSLCARSMLMPSMCRCPRRWVKGMGNRLSKRAICHLCTGKVHVKEKHQCQLQYNITFDLK